MLDKATSRRLAEKHASDEIIAAGFEGIDLTKLVMSGFLRKAYQKPYVLVIQAKASFFLLKQFPK